MILCLFGVGRGGWVSLTAGRIALTTDQLTTSVTIYLFLYLHNLFPWSWWCMTVGCVCVRTLPHLLHTPTLSVIRFPRSQAKISPLYYDWWLQRPCVKLVQEMEAGCWPLGARESMISMWWDGYMRVCVYLWDGATEWLKLHFIDVHKWWSPDKQAVVGIPAPLPLLPCKTWRRLM